MTNQNTAEAVIMFRAKDEASAEIEQLQQTTGKLDRGFNSLGKSFIASGLAAFGLSFSLKELAAASKHLSDVQGQAEAVFGILAPRMREAFAELDRFGLARQFDTTESQIKEIATVFARNAGDVELSAGDMATAIRRTFGLMALSGVDAATAAAALGQQLQGNETDLQKIGDASGRNRLTMEDLDEASLAYIDNLSGLGGVFAGMQRQWENFTESFGRFLEGDNPFEVIRDWWEKFWPDFKEEIGPLLLKGTIIGAIDTIVGIYKGLLDEYGDDITSWFSQTLPQFISDAVTGGLDGIKSTGRKIGQAINNGVWEPITSFFSGSLVTFFKDTVPDWIRSSFGVIGEAGKAMGEFFTDNIFDPIETFFTETLPNWFRDVVPGLLPEWFRDMFSISSGGGESVAGAASGGGGGYGSTTVVFNHYGNVDSMETKAQIAREIHRSMGEVNRRGLGLA